MSYGQVPETDLSTWTAEEFSDLLCWARKNKPEE